MVRYERASGQAINFDKSGIFLSQNVGEATRMVLSEILGVDRPLSTGHYLGFPSLIRHGKKTIFYYIRDRLWDRLSGWRTKKISWAGREVLIKSAAQAISCFLHGFLSLASHSCGGATKDAKFILVGSGVEPRKGVRWANWDKLCVHKTKGGLRFQNLLIFNLAMLERLGWKLFSNLNALVSRVLKDKYYPEGGLFEC